MCLCFRCETQCCPLGTPPLCLLRSRPTSQRKKNWRKICTTTTCLSTQSSRCHSPNSQTLTLISRQNPTICLVPAIKKDILMNIWSWYCFLVHSLTRFTLLVYKRYGHSQPRCLIQLLSLLSLIPWQPSE